MLNHDYQQRLPLFRTVWSLISRTLALLILGSVAARSADQPAVVAIVKGDNPDQMVAEAIELCGGLKDLIWNGRTVVIKPNLTSLRDGRVYPGQTTDVRVGAALVKAIKQAGNCHLSFAEGLNEGRLWEATGFAELANREGIALTNLAAGNFVPIKIDGLALKEYRFPEVIKGCDVFIDLPVMKTHRLTGISAGMKNLYGLLPFPRDVHHGEAERILSDLVSIRKPDLIVVDALVAMEGQGPLAGSSVPMNLIVAGRDIVAVDTVCAAIMGFDPGQVPHLNYAHERGLGENDLKKIVIKGVPIAQVQRRFKPAEWYLRLEMPGTPEVAKRIASLADKVTLFNSGQGGQEAEFDPGRLKVDETRYPTYKPPGFTVAIDRRARKIRFTAQYPVPSLDNRAATEEGLRRWISENLSTLTTVAPITTPLGEYP
jgi:uncharacterized protein (DUF362 family)